MLYVIKQNKSFMKIGFTSNITKRLSILQVGNPIKLELVCLAETLDDSKAEKYLHELFINDRVRGEWFFFNNRIIEEMKLIGTDVPVLEELKNKRFVDQQLKFKISRCETKLRKLQISKVRGAAIEKPIHYFSFQENNPAIIAPPYREAPILLISAISLFNNLGKYLLNGKVPTSSPDSFADFNIL